MFENSNLNENLQFYSIVNTQKKVFFKYLYKLIFIYVQRLLQEQYEQKLSRS